MYAHLPHALAAAMLCAVVAVPSSAWATGHWPEHQLTRSPADVGAGALFDSLLADESGEDIAESILASSMRVVSDQPELDDALDAAGALLADGLTEAIIDAAVYEDPTHPVSDQFGALPLPVETGTMQAGFGRRDRDTSFTSMRHSGVAFLIDQPTEALSIGTGVVVHSGYVDGLGGVVIVDHGSGVHTVYAQLLTLDVSTWDVVAAGESVGLAGATSSFGTAELYFEIRRGGVPEDPALWLDGLPIEMQATR